MRSRGFARSTDWPIGGNPLPGGVHQEGRKSDLPGGLIDPGCLDRRDLVPAQALADDIEAAGEGGIAEGAIRLPLKRRAYDSSRRFLGVIELALGLCGAVAIAPMVSPQRCIDGLRFQEVEADGPGFRAFGPQAVSDGLLGVLGKQFLQFALGALMLLMGGAGLAIYRRPFRPVVGCTHVDDANRL
jgi:hypothetical protein